MREDQTNKYMRKSEIIEKIVMYIKDNDLLEGKKLPSERKLCNFWKVNRSTMRSSLHRLVEDGILEAKHGKGYFIRKKKIVRNLQDLKSMSVVAEEHGRVLKTRVIRQDIIFGDKELSKIFKIDLELPILELVRVRYLDDEPVSIEYNYTDLIRCKGLEKVDFSEIAYYKVLELRYDLFPHSGSQEISITSLREEEAALLGRDVDSMALYMGGVTYDKYDKDIPIEVFKSILDPKTFSLVSYMKVIKKGAE